MREIEHKGYLGILKSRDGDGVVAGQVLGIRDVVTFQGDTDVEAEHAFQDSVDDYLAMCEERGEQPEKPFTGKVMLRISPELHRKVAIAADAKNISISEYIEEAMK